VRASARNDPIPPANPQRLHSDRLKIMEYAQAIGDPNAVYRDLDAPTGLAIRM
jgi:hypothetical protein